MQNTVPISFSHTKRLFLHKKYKAMLNQNAVDFLKDLSKNNYKEWFHENKKRYEKDLKEPFKALVTALIEEYKTLEPDTEVEAKNCIFRINRDIRFSKDKSPYKNNVGAIISKYGRKQKEYPGFYIHFEPGQLMIGGGAYFLPKDKLQALREHIINNNERFESIINAPEFKERFGAIKGDKNKRLPKELAAHAEKQPLIFNKQFFFSAEMPAKMAYGEEAVDFIFGFFKAADDFNRFLVEFFE